MDYYNEPEWALTEDEIKGLEIIEDIDAFKLGCEEDLLVTIYDSSKKRNKYGAFKND